MALEGALSEHGIAEILQLVATQNKTGILEVNQLEEAPSVKLYFSSGRIIRCDVEGRSRHDSLGERLVAAGVVDRGQLDVALKEQKKTLARLEDILVVRGAADRQSLGLMRGLQVRERIYGLFAHRKGRYRFEARAPNFTPVLFDPISTETVLMEGLRMAEEWPLIRTRVNNYDAVFRALKAAEDGQDEAEALEQILDDAFSEYVDPSAGEEVVPGLSRTERRVLELVDGKRSIHALIARTRVGEFETCKAVYQLLLGGYIEPVKKFRPRARPAMGSGRRWRRVITRTLVNLVVVVGLGALLYGLPQSRSALNENTAVLAAEVQARLRANRMQAIATGLEIYRLEHGAYPDGLAVLVDERLVAPDLLTPKGAPLDYVSIGTEYVLR
jgi:hypothetical protein